MALGTFAETKVPRRAGAKPRVVHRRRRRLIQKRRCKVRSAFCLLRSKAWGQAPNRRKHDLRLWDPQDISVNAYSITFNPFLHECFYLCLVTQTQERAFRLERIEQGLWHLDAD